MRKTAIALIFCFVVSCPANTRAANDLDAAQDVIYAWDGKSTVPVNGKLIKQIRTHLHRDDKKLRIVLDLDPEADYSVNPTYYRLNNIYCVEVKPSSGISQ
ncbi:MAG: hypothetical protein ABII68_08990 [Pseudomonadota bacterium]